MKSFALGFLLMVVGVIAFGQNPVDSIPPTMKNYEMLIVKRAWEGNSLYIFRKGEEAELIKMPQVSSKEIEIASMKLKQETFSKLYKEGWRLVATELENGYPTAVPEYYFEREIP